jgi:hypothetical protein
MSSDKPIPSVIAYDLLGMYSGFKGPFSKEPEFDFNAKKHNDAMNKILDDIYKEIEEEQNGT